MALKDKWKQMGKDIGHSFKNLGESIATTAKVAVGNEANYIDENNESYLKKSWKKTGKGFGEAGKSIGRAAKGTAQRVVGCDEEENEGNEKNEEN